MSRFIVATLCKVFTTLKGCETLHGGSKEVVHMIKPAMLPASKYVVVI